MLGTHANFSRVPKARRVEGRSPGTKWKHLLALHYHLNCMVFKHDILGRKASGLSVSLDLLFIIIFTVYSKTYV